MKENRLAREKSPYLLQHARNPVDWFPWGAEAFEKARCENKMIFLSIGYSTCHWCHVMEKESFESPEVAELMNRDFVAVKVDREERPDIDHVYMTAVQAMTGAGGWPLSVFLTPDGKPVTGGTYFPPEDKWGKPGMKTILPRLAEAWKTQHVEMNTAGDQLARLLEPVAQEKKTGPAWSEVFKKAYAQYENSFDQMYGGFGGAPKFPRSHELSFLLRFWKKNREPRALEMVQTSLDCMANGGIYDHLGGGFHRYSTDEHWLVPHFEKMLYDQALLARTYLEGYQASGKKFYADVARDVFKYVLRDMTSPDGGFYSAEDADSEGEEGKFYVWRPEEIDKILGVLAGKLFRDFYGVTDEGNFEHASSILHVSESVEAFAASHGLEPAKLDKQLAWSREKLFEERKKRIAPYKDDKILTAWNGLMISALAYGARVLDEPAWTKAAEKSAEFILKNLQKNGRLLRRFRDGQASIPAFQDDYAFLALGLLDLYEATFEIRWLDEAGRLLSDMGRLFQDENAGGFFYTARDAENLIVRTKEYYDGATPSGNSVAAFALVKHSRMTGSAESEGISLRTIESNAVAAGEHPVAFPFLLMAADFYTSSPREITIMGEKGEAVFQDFVKAANRVYTPDSVLLYQKEKKTAAAICSNRVCQQPLGSVEELKKVLSHE